MAHIISVINEKGGVGKTTTVAHLASEMANDYKVLLIDNDSQGSLTSWFFKDIMNPEDEDEDVIAGMNTMAEVYQKNAAPDVIKVFQDIKGMEKKMLDVIPMYSKRMQFSLINLAKKKDSESILKKNNPLLKHIDEYDFVFIDCGPSITVLTLNALLISDYVIIPVMPGPDELDGLERHFETLNSIRKQYGHRVEVLGVLINNLNKSKQLDLQYYQMIKDMIDEDKLFDTIIDHSYKLKRARHEQLTFDVKFKNLDDEEKLIYRKLKKEIIKKIG